MRILIDADGCPVVRLSAEIAEKHNIECIILCDTAHEFDIKSAKTITVSKGADSVDYALVNLIEKGDIAVTQDYGLAAMCLARNASAINQNGMIYDENNIDALLNSRYEAKKVRLSGGRMSGPPKRKKEQDEAFARALEKLIEKK